MFGYNFLCKRNVSSLCALQLIWKKFTIIGSLSRCQALKIFALIIIEARNLLRIMGERRLEAFIDWVAARNKLKRFLPPVGDIWQWCKKKYRWNKKVKKNTPDHLQILRRSLKTINCQRKSANNKTFERNTEIIKSWVKMFMLWRWSIARFN